MRNKVFPVSPRANSPNNACAHDFMQVTRTDDARQMWMPRDRSALLNGGEHHGTGSFGNQKNDNARRRSKILTAEIHGSAQTLRTGVDSTRRRSLGLNAQEMTVKAARTAAPISGWSPAKKCERNAEE